MWLERIFCLLIVGLGGSALLVNSGLLRGRWCTGMFVYYTNLSNLLMVVYHALLLAAGFAPAGGLYRALAWGPVRLCAAVCITVTHLIYHFNLVPYYKKHDPQFFQHGFYTYGNLNVHYIVPWLCVLCWAFTADKAVAWWAAALWLVLPISYTVFAVVRGKHGGPINGKPDGERYPYPFLDIDTLGAAGFAKNLVLYSTGFFLLGLAFVGLAALLK